jgi:outer membrane lipoprotein-sorting protein
MMRILIWTILALVPLSVCAQETDRTAKAVATLRKMHAHFTRARSIEFDTTFQTVDKVLGRRQRGTVRYILRKPNLLRVTADLPKGKVVIVSDGRTLTIHEPKRRKYREAKANDSIVGNLYLAAGLLGEQVRMIDFFWSINYIATLGEQGSLKLLPARKFGAATCDGFNIKRDQDSWDIWLRQSGIPLPCYLVSKRTDGTALVTQSNTFDWKSKTTATDQTFRFTPPPGHTKE